MTRAVRSLRTRGAEPSERGAAIVEFALVSVVLFTIIFGLIEGGLLVRSRNAINSVADEGARRGSIAADSQSADWQILQQLRVRGALSAANIEYVVIYNAATSTSPPTQGCMDGTPATDVCNVYERAEFELPSGSFTCDSGSLDGSWCPTDRAQDSTAFEYIGVYIKATHRGLTGIFPDVDLEAVSVRPLEGSGGV